MESDLQALLHHVRDGCKLSAKEASILADALCDRNSDYRPLVFSILSLNFSSNEGGSQDVSTEAAAGLTDFIESGVKGSELDIIHAVAILEALFQLNGSIASKIVMDRDLMSFFGRYIDQLTFNSPLTLAITSLVSQACSIKPMREQIGAHYIPWLQRISVSQEASAEIQTNALNALVKLSYQQTSLTGAVKPSLSGVVDLALALKDAFLRGLQPTACNQAIEGLAYTSSHPKVKDLFAKDSTFLSSILVLIPNKVSGTASSLYYGVLLIMTNLIATRPNLTEEEMQVRKLQALASSSGKSAGQPVDLETLESKEYVRGRIKSVLGAGWLAVLSRLSKLKCSPQTLALLATSWHNVVEYQEFRGLALQAGATKSLLQIIRTSLQGPSPSETQLEEAHSTAAQSIAKLAITAPPLQVFGPDGSQAIDGLAALRQLLFNADSTNLQKFEALMALTNLVTFNVEVATRIAQSEGLLERAQNMFLDNNLMIRRASVELVCNLVGSSEAAFREISTKPIGVLKAKLHVLIALSDVEDVATRLAASAVLAVISGAKAVGETLLSLELEKASVLDILLRLLDLSTEGTEAVKLVNAQGLFVRGCTIIINVISNCGDEKGCRTFLDNAMAKDLKGLLKVGLAQPMTAECAGSLLALVPTSQAR